MPLTKTYSRINWVNYPREDTPLNESNLNKIDYATNEIDNRVISLDTQKFNKADATNLIKEITFDEDTGIFTFTRVSGATLTIDTKLEKLAINFDYDQVTQELIIHQSDGTDVKVNLSSLISTTEFDDSDTIVFTILPNGHIQASVKEGSITADYLQPNYLADITIQAEQAKASEAAAELSSDNASKSEVNAKDSEEKALQSETNAKSSELLTETYKNSAQDSMNKAKQSEINAKNSENSAKDSETNAKDSETKSKTSETNAKQSENNAKTSETNSVTNAKLAESWTIGGTGTRFNENTNNSKYFSQVSESFSQDAKNSAELARQYADIQAPDFYLDPLTMILYMKAGAGVDFVLDENNILYWKISA